jgi:hypothetical protein
MDNIIRTEIIEELKFMVSKSTDKLHGAPYVCNGCGKKTNKYISTNEGFICPECFNSVIDGIKDI